MSSRSMLMGEMRERAERVMERNGEREEIGVEVWEEMEWRYGEVVERERQRI